MPTEPLPTLATDLHMVADLASGLGASRAQNGHTASNNHVELLAQALEQSPFGIIVMDIEGRAEYCNQSFTAMTGFTLNDIRDVAAHPWNTAESTDAVYRGLLSSQQADDRWNGDVQSHRKDGTTYWERQVVSTLRDADGKHTHLVVFKQDISERRRRKAAHELQEQALVSSSNGIMITRSDADDHSIVYVNPAFERITGYRSDEVIGREGRFLVRDDLAQPDLEEIRTALREKREGRALLRNYRKDGTLFWNELHISRRSAMPVARPPRILSA
jgi:PAS domain S-box-containing protein